MNQNPGESISSDQNKGSTDIKEYYKNLHIYGLIAILVLVIIVIVLLFILHGRDLGDKIFHQRQSHLQPHDAEFQTETATSLLRSVSVTVSVSYASSNNTCNLGFQLEIYRSRYTLLTNLLIKYLYNILCGKMKSSSEYFVSIYCLCFCQHLLFIVYVRNTKIFELRTINTGFPPNQIRF